MKSPSRKVQPRAGNAPPKVEQFVYGVREWIVTITGRLGSRRAVTADGRLLGRFATSAEAMTAITCADKFARAARENNDAREPKP